MTSLTAASSSPHALSVSYEVIDAVQRTLEKEGKITYQIASILQSIRSQLRESVLRVISSVSASTVTSSDTTSRASTLIHEKVNPNMEMALILVRDLLESMNLSESLIAFKSEVQNQIALSTINVGSDFQSLDWFSKGYKDTKNSLLLFASNGSMNYHRERELSLLETLIQLRQRDLSKESKDSGPDLYHAPAKKEQTPRWNLSDQKNQRDDVVTSTSRVRADEYKSAFDMKEDDLDEVDSELDIQYGHSAAADDTDDAEGGDVDYAGHTPASGPAIQAAAVATAAKTTVDSQSVPDKDISSSRLSMPLDMDESASFEDSNIELMSNSLNIDVSLPPPKQPFSTSTSTSSISGASSLPPLRAAGASSLPALKSQTGPRHSRDSKEDDSGPAIDDDENEEQDDLDGPENLSDDDDGEEVSADPESIAATRASSTRHISVRDKAPSSTTASSAIAASASSRASVQRLGQGSTVSRSVSGWGQSDDTRYDDFEVDEEDRESDPVSSFSRGSSVRSSFPSSIAAFPRPGAPGSSRGGPGAMSLDSEDPLLEELLDDVNALEQSHDQMQTSYRSNQEDEEDYFAQARKGRDRYDSKHEEKEEEDEEEEEEEEEAPSPMARDLDALSKMSNLRVDDGDEKPSRRSENKPEEEEEAGSADGDEDEDNYADDNYGDDFEDDDVNALLDDDRHDGGAKAKKQPQSWTGGGQSQSQVEAKKPPLESRSADEDAEAEEVQSVEDEVSAAHSDSDEEDREEKKEDKGDNKEMETGFGLSRSRSGGLLSGLPSLHPGVKQPAQFDNDDSFEQSEGSSYFPGSLGLGSRTQKDDDVVRNSASFNLGQYSVDAQDEEDISGEEVEGKISDIDKRLRELENMDNDGELAALKKKFTAPDSFSPRASVDRDEDEDGDEDEENDENVMEFSVGEDDEGFRLDYNIATAIDLLLKGGKTRKMLLSIKNSNRALLMCSLFVSRRSQQSQSSKDSNGETFIEGPYTIFDEYGSMPTFEDTFKLLEASSPVVVILGANFTLISFIEEHPGGLRSIIKPRTVIRLTDRLAVVVSGVVGDCRRVALVAKELVANHSFAYGAPPSGYLLASKLAQFMQEATTGSKRPFSCQIFVCSSLVSDGADRFILPEQTQTQTGLPEVKDTTTCNLEPGELGGGGYSMNRFLLRRRSVFSISPAGSLSLVQAACSGGGGGGGRRGGGLKGAQSMSQLLEAEYKPGLNVEEAGVSYPVLATQVSVDSAGVDLSSLVFAKCEDFEFEKKDSAVKQTSALPLLVKEHESEVAQIPTCEVVVESPEDSSKQSLEAVLVETICSGTIINCSEGQYEDDERRNCDIVQDQDHPPEIFSIQVEEMRDAEARSRCTSQGSEGTAGFMMDVVDLLQSTDPLLSRPPSFSSTAITCSTNTPLVADEELIRTEAEVVGRILEAACVNFKDMDRSGDPEPFDASIFDSIERDIECISLGDEDEQEQFGSEEVTNSSLGSSSPSSSSSLTTATRLLRCKRRARQQLSRSPPSSSSCGAADVREQLQKIIASLSCSAQLLQRTLADDRSGRPAASRLGQIVYSADQVVRPESGPSASVSCALPSPTGEEESERRSDGPVLLSRVVVAVPSSIVGARCHRIAAAANVLSEQGMLTLEPLDPDPTSAVPPPSPSVSSISSHIDPRKLATARRIRDGGKFKRIQTQWVSATDFFARQRRPDQGSSYGSTSAASSMSRAGKKGQKAKTKVASKSKAAHIARQS
eukprot:gene26085-34693_t